MNDPFGVYKGFLKPNLKGFAGATSAFKKSPSGRKIKPSNKPKKAGPPKGSQLPSSPANSLRMQAREGKDPWDWPKTRSNL